MSAKFFVVYGDKTITAHVADYDELLNWARRENAAFEPTKYATCDETVTAADAILLARYKVWGLFEHTPQGLSEFICAAAQADELAGLYALQIAQEYVQEIQERIALAFTKAQQKAIERVTFPIAGDKGAFYKYQEKIAEIRDLSINGLAEYVENGDESPE
jgi:hypothetical protein